jgi:hypothetical protein
MPDLFKIQPGGAPRLGTRGGAAAQIPMKPGMLRAGQPAAGTTGAWHAAATLAEKRAGLGRRDPQRIPYPVFGSSS